MLSEEVMLRVAEAKPRDSGRKIARVSRGIMRQLNVETGDFLELSGSKGSTIVQVWPAYGEDEGVDIIRVDGLIREVLGVGIGEYVKVKRAEDVKPASKVVLAPVEPVRFSGAIEEYVKRELVGKPLTRGDRVIVPFFGMGIEFTVVSTHPTLRVYITDDTQVVLREEPTRPEELKGVPRVTWEDIGDLEEAKEKIREMIELPLRHPEIFSHLGIEPPKGVLLYGPPGTGKTLLAKAVANEVGAYFIAINGPEIMSKFYGESEARLREIFKEAEENAPAIIFIDEIDAIAPRREEVTGEVEKRVVAQLLALMDGLGERGKVIVIAATNRPEAVDPALRRPGRFDREVEIRPPDARGRREILQVHTRNMPLGEDVNLEELAEMTHGYTGADLAALAKEAAMSALRRFLREGRADLTKPIPAEVLRSLTVSRRDFLEAMKYIQPSLLREIYVEVPRVHWEDIGGLREAKQELREAVEWPLKHPKVFKEMGIKPPRGVLLFGPPGTGKTLLAKAVATESEANFISVRGPEVLSKWVGESERAIREIFRKARQAAPCIIFFDEIDAIAPKRALRSDTSGVTDRMVNQLLTEMDGIVPLTNVVVIAATNRPDILDPALLRPGRFDRIIYVPPPDRDARFEIFKVHTRNMPLAEDVDLKVLAEKTEGYTGADIEAVCREAAILALRERLEARPVEMKYFLKALETVPPSLTRGDVEKYERLYREIKRATLTTTTI